MRVEDDLREPKGGADSWAANRRHQRALARCASLTPRYFALSRPNASIARVPGRSFTRPVSRAVPRAERRGHGRAARRAVRRARGGMADDGVLGRLADHECRFGRLPLDSTTPCGCWPQREPRCSRYRPAVTGGAPREGHDETGGNDPDSPSPQSCSSSPASTRDLGGPRPLFLLNESIQHVRYEGQNRELHRQTNCLCGVR